MATVEYGYLSDNPQYGYLAGPYLAGNISESRGMQVNQIINGKLARGVQVNELIVDFSRHYGMQVTERFIDIRSFAGMQISEQIKDVQSRTGMQVKESITDTLKHFGVQIQEVIKDVQNRFGVQVNMIVSTNANEGFQVNEIVQVSKATSMQVTPTFYDAPHLGVQISETVNVAEHMGAQVFEVIPASKTVGLQTKQIIAVANPRGMQVSETVNVTEPKGVQVYEVIPAAKTSGIQAKQIINVSPPTGMQISETVRATTATGMEVNEVIDGTTHLGFEVKIILGSVPHKGMQVKHDTLRHATLGVYLSYPYLTDPYLVDRMAAYAGMQINEIVSSQKKTGVQVLQIGATNRHIGLQVQQVVKTSKHLGVQFTQVQQKTFGFQITQVIYNAKRLRLLYEFPSRGTEALGGNNWVASSTAAGDFAAKNLNTDIVEQVWRSNNTPSNQTLTCDTGLSQGVPIDTIAILNANLTRSATIQVQGSQDNFLTPARITFNMSVETLNSYYISPTFPSSLGQNRYWRFIIQDATNPDGFIQIGTIIFGASAIFNLKEFFVNPLVFGYRHFKDSLPTEGFTTASNDRALKRYLKLSFKELDFSLGNFSLLQDMILFARTSLKVLVIPIPEYPSRYAVFGKLTALPEISYNDIDAETNYIDVDFEWDESL